MVIKKNISNLDFKKFIKFDDIRKSVNCFLFDKLVDFDKFASVLLIFQNLYTIHQILKIYE